MLKTTRVTVETDTLMIVRRAKAVLAWCPDCGAEVNVIFLSSEGLADAATAEQLQHWLNRGKLHVSQLASGPVQICMPSLLQCFDGEEAQQLPSAVSAPLNQLRRRWKMKATRWISNLFRLTCFALTLTLIGSAWAQQTPPAARYTVIDLGTLGGTFSLAYAINNRGQIDGFSTLPGDTVEHSFLYNSGSTIDLGTLGGPDSMSFSLLNNLTQVGGASDTGVSDPNGEDYCAFGTNLICQGFVWQNGLLSPVPALGGNNSQVAAVNARGQVAGYAETTYHDPDCVAPQVLQTLPTVWNGGHVQALATFPGDRDGAAFGMNDNGDVTGASGSCGAYDGRYGVALVPKHAVLWHRGRLTYLGSLGGQINNSGLAINNSDQVVGASDIAGDQYQHAFIWQNGTMRDMGTLPGDVVSAAVAVNNRGQATGVSVDNENNIRGFLWQNGVMMDLNDLIPPNSPLYLLHGFGINDSGEIVGFAYIFSTGEVHGFLAIPTTGAGAAPPAGNGGARKLSLPKNARRLLQQYVHARLFASEAAR